MSANTALFVSPSVVPSSSINGLAEDVWFGIRTDGVAGTITGPLVRNSDGTVSVTGTAVITGNGSAINPYDASDYIKFDALMRMLGHPVSTTFSGSIVSVGTGNPATVTTAPPHGMQTGVPVTLASVSGSTPTVNGSHIITVTGPTTFTIPVNVTVGGTGGTFTTTYGVVPAFTIHLGKGEFKTLGQMMPDSTYSFPAYNSANYPTYLPDNTGGYTTTGWYMYSGWRILGEGQGSTTLSLDHWPIYGGSPYPYGISLIDGSDGSLGYWADDTEVANLTIDCNWPYITGKPVGATALNAILLYGDRIKVHDITVLNAYGQSPAEAFVVFLTRRITDGFFLGQGYPNVSLDSKNLRIEHTISDLWQGSYGSALAIDPGFTGGCFLIDNYVHNWITGTSALQGGGNYGEVAGNTIENAGTGFYTEATASGINNFHFHHNILLGIRHSAIEISLGVIGTPGNSDGCVIEENTIIADLANASSPSMIHCFVSTTGSLTNLRIADNYITKTGSHGGTLYGINTAFANGLTITGNTIVSALSNQLVSCTNTTLSGNRDQNGAVASGLTDTTLPATLGGTGLTAAPNGIVKGDGATTYGPATPWSDYTPKIPLTRSNINSSSVLIAVNTETTMDYRGTVFDDLGIAQPPYYKIATAGIYRVDVTITGDGADWRIRLYKNVGGTLSGSNPTTLSGGSATLLAIMWETATTFGNFTVSSVVQLSANDIMYTTVKQTSAGGGANLYYDVNYGTKITFERIQ